jgi:hypothetical protein
MAAEDRMMPCYWTPLESGAPLAAFFQPPDFWAWFAVVMVVSIALTMDRIEKKLDRILNHLGLSTEIEKPRPTELQSRASPELQAFQVHMLKWSGAAGRVVGRVWSRRELRSLRRLVGTGVAGAARFVDQSLYQTPSGKGPAQEEV